MHETGEIVDNVRDERERKAVHVRSALTCGQDSDHRNARFKYKNDVRTRQRVNEALDAAELSYDGDLNVRHACEC